MVNIRKYKSKKEWKSKPRIHFLIMKGFLVERINKKQRRQTMSIQWNLITKECLITTKKGRFSINLEELSLKISQILINNLKIRKR